METHSLLHAVETVQYMKQFKQLIKQPHDRGRMAYFKHVVEKGYIMKVGNILCFGKSPQLLNSIASYVNKQKDFWKWKFIFTNKNDNAIYYELENLYYYPTWFKGWFVARKNKQHKIKRFLRPLTSKKTKWI